MYFLSAPTRDPVADFDSIVSRRQSPAKEALIAARGTVVGAYSAYRTVRGDGSSLVPVVAGDPLKQFLRSNFASLDKGGNHRRIRDELKAHARFHRCVYCSYHRADTLDHFQPRTEYAEFSALAENLIPACARCNGMKREACYRTTGKPLPHPYFETLPQAPFLFVEVLVRPASVTWDYVLANDGAVDPNLFAAIVNLFELLELCDFYAEMSVGDVSERVTEISNQYTKGRGVQVHRYLDAEADSTAHAEGENFWKTALLRGLAASHDFCDGGFRALI